MTLTLHPAGDSFGTELAGCWLLSSALPFRRHHWSHRLQVWSVCVWEPAGHARRHRPVPAATPPTARRTSLLADALLLPMISEAVRFAFSRSLLGFWNLGRPVRRAPPRQRALDSTIRFLALGGIRYCTYYMLSNPS